jgi:hypothetical protein
MGSILLTKTAQLRALLFVDTPKVRSVSPLPSSNRLKLYLGDLLIFKNTAKQTKLGCCLTIAKQKGLVAIGQIYRQAAIFLGAK